MSARPSHPAPAATQSEARTSQQPQPVEPMGVRGVYGGGMRWSAGRRAVGLLRCQIAERAGKGDGYGSKGTSISPAGSDVEAELLRTIT